MSSEDSSPLGTFSPPSSPSPLSAMLLNPIAQTATRRGSCYSKRREHQAAPQLHGKLQEARDEAGYHRQSHLKRRPTPSSSSTPSTSSGNPSKRRRTTFSMDNASGQQESAFTILPPITTDPLAEQPSVQQSESSSGSASANGGAAPPGGGSYTRSGQGRASFTSNGNAATMADLPPTETLEQLVDLFIANEPHASRIFHAQRLRDAIALLSLPPQSTSRLPSPAQRSGSIATTATTTTPPSKALLHAICASAARYVIPPANARSASNPAAANNGTSSGNGGNPPRQQLQQLPPGFAEYHADRARRLVNAALTEHQDTLYLEQDGIDVSSCTLPDENAAPSASSHTIDAAGRPSRSSTSDSSSSSSAITRTRANSSRTGSRDDGQLLSAPPMDDAEDRDARKRRIRMKRDSKLFADMVQPLIVLAAYYYHEGRGPEVWADVGALTRAIMSLGLNHPSEPPRRNSSKETLIAQEERKRAFWSTFMLDRLLSVGGWSHSMTEEDTVRNFSGNAGLLNAADFRDLGMPRSPKPQHQQSKLYVQAKGPDSYSLLLDAVVLLGRITDFRNRARLNHRSPLAQSI
ncbi:hypothetical protein FRC01_007078, partial [Tulasnella sp. 417]